LNARVLNARVIEQQKWPSEFSGGRFPLKIRGSGCDNAMAAEIAGSSFLMVLRGPSTADQTERV